MMTLPTLRTLWLLWKRQIGFSILRDLLGSRLSRDELAIVKAFGLIWVLKTMSSVVNGVIYFLFVAFARDSACRWLSSPIVSLRLLELVTFSPFL